MLSLLREEFPDVTISKIRFLESQGLVDPERTPSGYRKFYEHDVERLRWILRQQREHFLPLKVIRGRLSEQSADVAETGAGEPAAVAAGPGWAAGAEGAPGSAAPNPVTSEGPSETRRAGAPAPADREAAEPQSGVRQAGGSAAGREPADRAPESRAAAAVEESPAPGTGIAQGPSPAGPTPARPGTTPSLFAGLHGRAETPAEPEQVPTPRSAGGPEPVPAQAPPVVAVPTPGAPVPPAGTVGGPRPGIGAVAVPSGPEEADTFTAEELAAAAGAEAALVSDLKQFGLIAPHAVVAGTPYYDAGAVAVARAAADFARHGVEARHLRIWRNAADREADLFQQVVLPLLRQRNPQARRQAADTLSDLARAGAELRAALVERALREIR